ncbi:MAG: hypothetical protein QT08_C0014G0048 [archaeon GW2011_AR17]|nr:MAG: hypothetical protein QT08_C0014G0048 [archaeon GW2011_AR17]MBS3154806.1 serine hydrolase family protein [Candidatus Woesearchaeota archaeon]HIH15763.1 serine hydrolase family protein [Nanoarchaeota archaeon]HIH58980.1 serine hydrolase family protein [Nanoarchaeota archaeon]HII14357.1 serine hydrolase family protein [Nanoarchaeota archaeon]
MKQAYFVHGWEGSPTNIWFPWLKKEVEKLGYKVKALKMPHPELPTIKEWVRTLEKEVNPSEETILIGHSIGCQTIMRYLEKPKRKVKAAFFAAPWFNLDLEDEGEEAVREAKPWVETPINFIQVKKNCNYFVAFFSDDDWAVPTSDAELFKQKINAKIIIQEKKSHFELQMTFPGLLAEIKKAI